MTSLLGHDTEVSAFLEGWRAGRLHHAWLLAGTSGIGKRRFADLAALHVLANAAGPATAPDRLDVSPDHPIAHLIEAGSHLDLRIVEREEKKTGDLASGIGIDQIRALQPLLQSTPALSPWRVVIVDAIDDLARAAANALLKSLEEPPPNTVFLLVSHAPGRLLPTIRSRCRILRFNPLEDDLVAAVLSREMPELAQAERDALVAIADGAPGRALRFAGLDIAALGAAVERLTGSGARSLAERAALAESLKSKTAQPRYEVFLDLVPRRIAAAARGQQGAALARSLSLWEKARDLAASAVPLSLDPYAVVFELAGMLAALDPIPMRAQYG